MYDLRQDGYIESYTGHTVIVIGVSHDRNSISLIQGHTILLPQIDKNIPLKESIDMITRTEGNSPEYRRFRYDKLLS